MTVRFIKKVIDCIEFEFYINSIGDELICEIDLVLDIDVDKIEEFYSETFILSAADKTYVFGNYELSEYFKKGEYTKVILIKK